MPIDLHLPLIDRVFRTNVDGLDFAMRDYNTMIHCNTLEQDALECLEAYGSRRGSRLCKEFIADFTECVTQFYQVERVTQMKRERIKQVLRGERKPMEVFDSIKPPRDSFQHGPFIN
ncbi:hypothetical protein SSS_03557 [Sarcoptes scabiei]|nr:hypothetical protein SSS_03557 [Sarcoptes scabiei]